MTEVMAYDEAHYLDIGTSSASDIKLLNVGVTQLDENSNPTEKERQYIGDKSKTTTVTGFANEFPINSDLISSDEVIAHLYGLFRDRKTGANAQMDYYCVELWNKVGSIGTSYKARKLKVSAVLSGKVSAPGETITFNGSLKGVGDFVDGTFNTATKTFTETATSL